MIETKLFAKYCGKWYEVNHIHAGKIKYAKADIVVDRYPNGKPLSYLRVPLDYCSKIKFKKVKK